MFYDGIVTPDLTIGGLLVLTSRYAESMDVVKLYGSVA